MYIVVIGEDGAGKSTVARALGSRLGVKVIESGQVLAEKFARMLSETSQRPEQSSDYFLKNFQEKKALHRPALKSFGDSLATMAPDRLVRECLGDNTQCIVVGLRRQSEREAWRRAMRKRGVPSVWIRVARASATNGDFELGDSPCEFVIHNDGSIKALKQQVAEVATVLRSRRFMQAA
jgi:dephospho-CoA kinase